MDRRGFRHHAQVHEYGCAAAALRMVHELLTGRDRGEAHFRRALGQGPRGATVADVQRVLAALLESTTPAPAIAWVDVARAARRLRRGRLAPDTFYLLFCDSYEPDGTNVGHWVLALDVVRAERRPVVVLADPLAAGLRAQALDALLAERVRWVYEIVKGRAPRPARRRRPRG